jgi:dolichol kinase
MVKNKPNLAFEMKRKFVHSLSVGYILMYYLGARWFGHQTALMIMLATFIGIIVFEYLRIKEKHKMPLFQMISRPKEENSLAGHVYTILGAIIAFSIFDFNIAAVAILMMTFGDMAAALFGITFGRHWMRLLADTAWEGVIAEFVVDLVIALLILKNPYIAIGMALMATVVETVLSHVDDNLAIPVFAGFVGQGLSLIF